MPISFFMAGNVTRSSYSIRHRQERGALMRQLLRPLPDWRILDLGGGDGSHLASILPGFRNITVCDFSARHLQAARDRFGFTAIRADACCPLPFVAGAFDLVWCSSVIEHITGPGSVAENRGSAFRREARRRQAELAGEIARVSRRFWVQTPHPLFPIDAHTLLPAPVLLLPRPMVKSILRSVSGASWWPATAEPDYHLVSHRRFTTILPGAKILVERSVGLPKSLIAYR